MTRFVLLMSVSCFWAGASALSFGRANLLPDEDNDEGSLLRGRSLNTFLELLEYDYAISERDKEGNGNGEGCKWKPDYLVDIPSNGSKGKGGRKDGSGYKGEGGAGYKRQGRGNGSKHQSYRMLPEGTKMPPTLSGVSGGEGYEESKYYDSKGSKSGGKGSSTGSKGTNGKNDYNTEVPDYCICRPEDSYDDCHEREECCPDDDGRYGYCVPEGKCEGPALPELPETQAPSPTAKPMPCPLTFQPTLSPGMTSTPVPTLAPGLVTLIPTPAPIAISNPFRTAAPGMVTPAPTPAPLATSTPVPTPPDVVIQVPTPAPGATSTPDPTAAPGMITPAPTPSPAVTSTMVPTPPPGVVTQVPTPAPIATPVPTAATGVVTPAPTPAPVPQCHEDGTDCLSSNDCDPQTAPCCYLCCNEAISNLGTTCGGEKWPDGTLCIDPPPVIDIFAIDSCIYCENNSSFWLPLFFTACGTCMEDGTQCDPGSTCRLCCNEARDDHGTKCGGAQWTDGTPCRVGASCNFCENEATFWPTRYTTACGACREDGTLCSAASPCDLCCNEASDGMQCGGGETAGDCDCRGDFPELDGALCYPKCPPGDNGETLRGVGPLCYYDCPENFRDDGLFCAKPGGTYGRGAGYTLLAGGKGQCEADHGVGNCEEGSWTIWHKKCDSGFVPVGCCICSPQCPEGFSDIGVSCRKPAEVGRGVGQAVPCVKSFFDDRIGCLKNAVESKIDVLGLESIKEAFSDFNEIQNATDFGEALTGAVCPIATVIGATAGLTTSLLSCVTGIPVTLTVGITVDYSALVKGVLTYGIAIDPSGDTGCFLTACAGGGLALGTAAGLSIGVLFDEDICTLKGFSTGGDIDLDVEIGGGVGLQFTDAPTKLQAEFVISAGALANVLGITRCQTFLSTSSNNPDPCN